MKSIGHKRPSAAALFAVALSIPTQPPDILINGFKLEQSKNNQRFFEMSAPEADIYKNEQIARARSPKTKIYQNSENNPVELVATEAVAHLGSYDMYFKDSTQVKTPEGFIVQAHNVSYFHKEEKISTPEAVQFESTPEFKASIIQGWGKTLKPI